VLPLATELDFCPNSTLLIIDRDGCIVGLKHQRKTLFCGKKRFGFLALHFRLGQVKHQRMHVAQGLSEILRCQTNIKTHL